MTGTPWTAARWTQVAGWVSLLAAAGIALLEARARRDPPAARIREASLASARGSLAERTCEHQIPDGKRLLGESRRALDTILQTALAWRLTGEPAFRDRCIAELDVAEMATAAAAWRVEPASPGSPRERPNQGFHLLVAECPRAAHVTIEVTIRPRPPVAP